MTDLSRCSEAKADHAQLADEIAKVLREGLRPSLQLWDWETIVSALRAHPAIGTPDADETCLACMGSGYSNNPDSGEICHACNGQGLAPATPDKLADLVNRFATALLEKLRAAEQKYGYLNGWARDDWKAECQRHLNEHLAKGDPRDVAAYCAFLWHHGWPTVAIRTPDNAREALDTAEKELIAEYHSGLKDGNIRIRATMKRLREALAALPREQEAKPVAWQARDKVHGGIWAHSDYPHSNPDFEYRPLFAAPPSDSPGSAHQRYCHAHQGPVLLEDGKCPLCNSHQPQGGEARGLLVRARQFVADAGCDEDDHDVNLARDELLADIDKTLATPAAPVRAAAEPGEMLGPSETWAHIEHLLVNECGLMTDCGLEHQRSNCINAIQNGLPNPAVLAAAIEFLNSGEGLHKIRVNGKMVDRKAVAAALSPASAKEGSGR